MRPSSSKFEHMRSGAERAAESHTEYASRMLAFKPPTTLAASMQQPASSQAAGAAGAAGAGAGNPFVPSGPQTGKVVSVDRSELFGTTHTVLRVLLDRGGERTIRVAANAGPVKVAMDLAEGDRVRLNPTGPQQWEWAKVVTRQWEHTPQSRGGSDTRNARAREREREDKHAAMLKPTP